MDAANIDLKAFTERFYRDLCGASLEAVKETLVYVVRETTVWVEITTLLIPDENDSDAEIDALTGWIADALGVDVPLHFTAFHPAWRLNDRDPTPVRTLLRARARAQANGLHHVYTGNVRDTTGASTVCHACGAVLLTRSGYDVQLRGLGADGVCMACGTICAGVFDDTPPRSRVQPRQVRPFSV
jgi:pyruvate formate lyase activating enzyme